MRSKRIDYVFVTGGVEDAIISVGHHPFHQHLVSEHKGIHVQFLASKLFDSGLADKYHMSMRKLKTTNRGSVKEYIAKLEKLYAHHKIWERLQVLEHRLKMVPSGRARDSLIQ